MADLFIQAGRLYVVATGATATNNNLAFIDTNGKATDFSHGPVAFAGRFDVRLATIIAGQSAQAVVGDGSADVSIKFPLSNEKLGVPQASGSALKTGDLAYASGNNECSDDEADGPLLGKVVGFETPSGAPASGALVVIKPEGF